MREEEGAVGLFDRNALRNNFPNYTYSPDPTKSRKNEYEFMETSICDSQKIPTTSTFSSKHKLESRTTPTIIFYNLFMQEKSIQSPAFV